jgi:acyl carrier protein
VQAIRQAVSEQHDIQVSTIVLIKPASLPRTSSGKIQRSQCRTDFLENRLVVIDQWTETKSTIELPQIEAPTAIAAIEDWLILRLSQTANIAIEDIDPSLPFASYGLDSSLLLSLTGELSDWLNLRLMPTVFWESPNIDSLALNLSKQIEQSSKPEWEPLL